MNIVVEAAALADLLDARDYYREHASLRIAEALLDQFDHAIGLLHQHPAFGTPLTERLRGIPLRRFPYSIIYEQQSDQLVVLAVAHHRRRPGYWANRA